MALEPQPSKAGVTRRGFVAAVSVAAALPVLSQSVLADEHDEHKPRPAPVAPGIVVTQKPADIRDGTITTTWAEKHGFFLVRQDNTIYAIDNTCTHQGCAVDATPAGMHCDCHGAKFDVLGNVTGRPAKKPLARYAIRLNASGLVEVDTGKKVGHDSPEGMLKIGG